MAPSSITMVQISMDQCVDSASVPTNPALSLSTIPAPRPLPQLLQAPVSSLLPYMTDKHDLGPLLTVTLINCISQARGLIITRCCHPCIFDTKERSHWLTTLSPPMAVNTSQSLHSGPLCKSKASDKSNSDDTDKKPGPEASIKPLGRPYDMILLSQNSSPSTQNLAAGQGPQRTGGTS